MQANVWWSILGNGENAILCWFGWFFRRLRRLCFVNFRVLSSCSHELWSTEVLQNQRLHWPYWMIHNFLEGSKVRHEARSLVRSHSDMCRQKLLVQSDAVFQICNLEKSLLEHLHFQGFRLILMKNWSFDLFQEGLCLTSWNSSF